jgi:AraC family transcriptional regulator
MRLVCHFVELIEGDALEARAGVADNVLRRAMAWLDQTPASGWSVQAASRAVGVSAATLTRRAWMELGHSFARHIRQLRVERAASLLRDTRLPLSVVAAHCGYADDAHLVHSFRWFLGCTPGAYRDGATEGMDPT